MGRSKKRNNHIHFRRRLLERYDIRISGKEYRKLCQQVKNGISIFLGRQTPSRTVHQVSLLGKKFIVVYDTNAGNIATVLFPGRTYKLV